MWTIRKSHQHIRAVTLNEYLDGRLQGSALARVDQQLASCDVCREELESLRATVAMLRDLPVEAPIRSFIMAAPPVEPVPDRHSPLVRVPQWVYAGAASVAVIALAVLVSADATGLLSPENQTTEPAAAAITPPQLETEVAKAAIEAREPATPALAAAAPVAEEAASEASTPSIAMAAEAESIQEPTGPIAIEDQQNGVRPSGGTPEPGLQTAAPEERTTLAASDGQDQVPIAEAATEQTPEQRGATATFWRVLEGLAGALGLVFLAGLTLRWKISRRTGRV